MAEGPFPYSLRLSVNDGIAGPGTSGGTDVFVSGRLRAAEDGLDCATLAGSVVLK